MQDAHARFTITWNQRTLDRSLGPSRRPCADASLEGRGSESEFHKHSFLLIRIVVVKIVAFIILIAVATALTVIVGFASLCCKVKCKHSFVFHSHSAIVFSISSANIQRISQSRMSGMKIFSYISKGPPIHCHTKSYGIVRLGNCKVPACCRYRRASGRHRSHT